MGISEVTDPLWAMKIDELHIDSFSGAITIRLIDEVSKQKDSLRFNGVSTYLWICNSENDYYEMEYPEFTAIHFSKTTLDSSADEWFRNFNLDYNVLIEVLDANLLIKAREVLVNEERFVL